MKNVIENAVKFSTIIYKTFDKVSPASECLSFDLKNGIDNYFRKIFTNILFEFVFAR